MKKLIFSACGIALALFAPSSVFADTIFDFTFGTGYVRGGNDVPFGGSGQFVTQNIGTAGTYVITGVSGTLTGNPIGGQVITGLESGFDNLLTFRDGTGTFEGNDGVGFLFSLGSVDLHTGVFPVYPYSTELVSDLYLSSGAELATAGITVRLATPAAAATPEPGTFVLLATGGLGVIGQAATRSRRSKQS